MAVSARQRRPRGGGPGSLTVEDDDERGITVSAAVDGVTVAEADVDPETMEDAVERRVWTAAAR